MAASFRLGDIFSLDAHRFNVYVEVVDGDQAIVWLQSRDNPLVGFEAEMTVEMLGLFVRDAPNRQSGCLPL